MSIRNADAHSLRTITCEQRRGALASRVVQSHIEIAIDSHDLAGADAAAALACLLFIGSP